MMLKLLMENWRKHLDEYTKEEVSAILRAPSPSASVDSPGIPEPAEEVEEDIDFVGVLDAAIKALQGTELAGQLDQLKQQIVPASEFEGGAGDDYRRSDKDPGFMGFEEE